MGRLVLSGVLLLITRCASTKVESTWTNPSFPARKIRSFAVFASTGYPSGRIEFEQTLTEGLRRRGLDAIPGYQFVSYDEQLGTQELFARVQAKGSPSPTTSRPRSPPISGRRGSFPSSRSPDTP